MPYGYAKILNAQLKKAFTNPLWIPDFRCMVGSAEHLAPVAVLVPQIRPKTPDAVKDTNDIPYERLQTNIDGVSLSKDDFPSGGKYLGRATGGY